MICKIQYTGGSLLLLNTGGIRQSVLEINIVVDPELYAIKLRKTHTHSVMCHYSY